MKWSKIWDKWDQIWNKFYHNFKQIPLKKRVPSSTISIDLISSKKEFWNLNNFLGLPSLVILLLGNHRNLKGIMIIFAGKMAHNKSLWNLIILAVREWVYKTQPRGVLCTWQMIQVSCFFRTKLQEVGTACILKRRSNLDLKVIFLQKNWIKRAEVKWIFWMINVICWD